jgi:hypothetical protein
MLGFSVFQATVSRYLPAPGRRPTQSWQSFLCNQASALGQYSEAPVAGIRAPACSVLLGQAHTITATQIAAVGIGLRRGLGQDQPAPNARRISIRSAQHERAAMHRVPRLAAVFGSLHQARSNRLPSAVAVRSPPTAITRESGCCLLRGPGFEKLQLLDRDPVFCTILHRFLKSCDEGELQRLV